MSETLYPPLQSRLENDVLVCVLGAEQMQGDELMDALRQELLAEVAKTNAKKVVLDFQRVRYLGSAGFRPLLSLYRKLKESGGRMIFVHLAPDLEEVFHITKLLRSAANTTAPFEAAPDLAGATARFAEATPATN